MSSKNERRRRKRPSITVGAPPGTLNIDVNAPKPVITAYAYDGETLQEHKDAAPESLAALRKAWPLVWVNVDGLGDAKTLETVGSVFGLHPLSLEDIVNVVQRPKVETYDTYQFVVLRMISLRSDPPSDQMSLVLGKDFVLTFQERAGDCFDPVRLRLRKNTPRLRACHADYLAYALIDALIDSYFPLLEQTNERLDDLQDEVLMNPSPQTVHAINRFKRDLITVRRAIWPLRDELSVLGREGSMMRPETRIYVRDCYDHTIVLMDMLETQREIAGGLMDVYLSSVSARMNEVMKVLTIIATIFIPLTFIAGVYGMNFNPAVSPWNMPELNAYWGYPLCWATMIGTAAVFIGFIWRLGWFKSAVVTPPSQ